MTFSTLLLGLSLLSHPVPGAADTVPAPKPKPEQPAVARPTRQEPKAEPQRKTPPKPLPLGEPKLKRRKIPD